MNYKMMGRFNALILTLEAAFMLPALLICLVRKESAAMWAFLFSMGIALALAGLLALFCRGAKRDFFAREGLICVGSSWLLMSAVGALPLMLSGAVPNYVDALFEMVSGFTTTGSTVISDLNVIPRGIIYWRSFSNWLGGMGVLVFLLALLPVSGRNQGFTMHLLRAESPGPDVGKLVPKMRQTAGVLYLCYLTLSLLDFLFLLAGGMSIFDAACTAMSTAGTGGFGVYNDSFAGFSPYVQYVTAVFMLLFGINFSCYYLLLLRQVRGVFKDEELRLYFGIVIASVALITWNIFKIYGNLSDSFRHALFQVSSLATSTGFASADFDLWPTFSKGILLILMFLGACAGSTGGGLKLARFLLLCKSMRRNISQILHPNKVKVIRVNEKTIDEKIVANTSAYFFVYMLLVLGSFLLLALDGNDLLTGFSAAVSCFNNMGPGFGAVGPSKNFAELGVLSKITLIFDMLAGRLEIFPILILFNPRAWKRG